MRDRLRREETGRHVVSIPRFASMRSKNKRVYDESALIRHASFQCIQRTEAAHPTPVVETGNVRKHIVNPT